MALNFTGLTAA
jgi:hypothetical protein